MAESQKEKLMRVLDLTEEEAEEVLAYDKAVDHNEKTEFDLTKEQQKVAKSMTISKEHKTPTVKTPKKREENTTKTGIIAKIAEFLAENAEIGAEFVEITNKERQIAFKIGENTYEFTLVQKRKLKS